MIQCPFSRTCASFRCSTPFLPSLISLSLRLQAPSGALKPSSSTEAIPEPEQALPSSSSSERLSLPLPTQEPPKPQPPPTITGPFKMNMQKYVSPSVASRFTNGALKLETPDTKLLKEQNLERPKFAASRLVVARPSSPKERGLGTRLG